MEAKTFNFYILTKGYLYNAENKFVGLRVMTVRYHARINVHEVDNRNVNEKKIAVLIKYDAE
jgi:hypothetical protein